MDPKIALLYLNNNLNSNMFEWFEDKTNSEVYYFVFHSLMMRSYGGRKQFILRNSQREQLVPVLNQILAQYKEVYTYRILDVGAGSGEIVDLSFQFMQHAVISIEDPNPLFLKSYLKRIQNYSHLESGKIYLGPIQDLKYNENGRKWLQKLPEQHMISAVHMIYHLTDFNSAGVIDPEGDLIEMISMLYEKLCIGGTLFLVYAEQLEAMIGSLSYEYFLQKSLLCANNVKKIWTARKHLLREGRIQSVLQNRYPEVRCTFEKSVTNSLVYGHNESELALMCLIGEMGTVDSELLDVDKLHFCFNLIRNRREEFYISVECDEGPRQGMLRGSQPQVICVIRKTQL